MGCRATKAIQDTFGCTPVSPQGISHKLESFVYTNVMSGQVSVRYYKALTVE